MESNRLMELEPSEEFPILFGLLTERKKGNGRPSLRSYQNQFRRVISSSSQINRSSSVSISEEPDSSTPEDSGTVNPHQDVVNLPKVTGESTATDTTGQLYSSASPLLILRLTSAETTNRRFPRNRRPNGDHEFQIVQRRRPYANYSKVISDDDECTPTSTTSEHEEIPTKRPRSNASSLPSPNSGLGPLLEPMVSTSSAVLTYSTSQSVALSSSPGNVETSGQVTGGVEYEDIGAQTVDNSLPLPNISTSNVNASSNSSVFYNPEARSYNCDYCDLKFKRQFHLLRHVASHEEKREVCCHCNTAFYRKDNLLVHQSKCQQRQGQRPLKLPPIFRQSRPPPKTLADLLDRDYDRTDQECDTSRSSNDNSYIHLPIGLEISEVPNETEEEVTPPPTSVPVVPNRRRATETVSVEESEEEPEPNEDNNVVEIFPCGHCREVFETFSRLLKHTASKHIKNPTDGTFHFEIETILNA